MCLLRLLGVCQVQDGSIGIGIHHFCQDLPPPAFNLHPTHPDPQSAPTATITTLTAGLHDSTAGMWPSGLCTCSSILQTGRLCDTLVDLRIRQLTLQIGYDWIVKLAGAFHIGQNSKILCTIYSDAQSISPSLSHNTSCVHYACVN